MIATLKILLLPGVRVPGTALADKKSENEKQQRRFVEGGCHASPNSSLLNDQHPHKYNFSCEVTHVFRLLAAASENQASPGSRVLLLLAIAGAIFDWRYILAGGWTLLWRYLVFVFRVRDVAGGYNVA